MSEKYLILVLHNFKGVYRKSSICSCTNQEKRVTLKVLSRKTFVGIVSPWYLMVSGMNTR